MKCEFCAREEVLPFVCKHCGGVFCSDHQSAELHRCSAIQTPTHEQGIKSKGWIGVLASVFIDALGLVFKVSKGVLIVVVTIILYPIMGLSFIFGIVGGIITGSVIDLSVGILVFVLSLLLYLRILKALK